MQFSTDNSLIKTGEKFGYLIAYLLFTTILFIILTLLNKLPLTWNYFHIAGITLIITIIGSYLKKL